MSADLIAPLFIALAMVVMVLLWRRGPARRRAFYLAGLVAAVGSFLFAAAYDEVDRRAAELPNLALPQIELAMPEFELTSLLEVDQPGTAWDDLEMDRVVDEPETGLRPAALPERIGLAADAMLPHPLEMALNDVPELGGCDERLDRAMRPATLVLSCGIDDDVELRIARFVRQGQAQEWFRHRASGVPWDHRPQVTDGACRSGQPAKGSYDTGEIVCWTRRDTQHRIAWTDEDRRLAGLLISDTVPFAELYRTWRDGSD